MIYLDNSATTFIHDEVLEVLNDIYKNKNFNPSSAYDVALQPEKEMKNARKILANSINADEDEIYFTSGGSEGNNSAILGIANANKNKGRHIISSMAEHDCVYNCLKYLQDEMNFEVTFLKPDRHGIISAEQLAKSVRRDTILVSIMQVNNELGSLNDIKTLVNTTKSINKMTYFHTDAVQSYMKVGVDVKEMGVDLLTTSGHKIHAPKGVGFLYIKKNTKISPLIFGGGQERGFRGGTENVAGICAMARAVEIMQGKDVETLRAIRDYLCDLIKDKIDDIYVNTPDVNAPHILNVSFAGTKSEVLQHYLEQDKIYVSTGSACSSKKKNSRVLESIGMEEKYIDSTLRFSLCHENTRSQMKEVVERLQKYVLEFRKITKYRGRR
ncbi:aminotransferase, class V [[Eubacterium] yurii subsp. margaretiae ATCC 43715]|nr:aminotransferase, class V [[Eubacterium] yurii subsp. margaretiae ATCC 43715]